VRVRALGHDRFEQEVGEVRVGPAEELEGIRFVPVDVGNPHAVVEGDPAQLPQVGPLLESHPRFPERTNVQVARVEGPRRIRARVWERGAGETASSGSSAVAVAAALVGEGEIAVAFPGGELHVRIRGTRATLTGPAVRVG
jgi:diaminopimelate epimerase